MKDVEAAKNTGNASDRETEAPAAASMQSAEQSNGWRPRIAGLMVVLATLTPLGLARVLSPSPNGLGTHQQLGLPPCSMRVLFGIRCPACGMTTSWSYWTRGQLIASCRANAGGMLLAFLAIASAMVGLRVLWTGGWPSYQVQRGLAVAGLMIAGVTLVDWIMRMSLGS